MRLGALSLRRPGRDKRFPPTVTGWAESTHAELAWNRSRGAAVRWSIGGAVLGAIGALIAFAPASWLASAVADATGQSLLLADARGTVWNGSALPVLTGGAGSRDAASLPGRLHWSIGLKPRGIELRIAQSCCLAQSVPIVLRPGLGRFAASLAPGQTLAGRWPAAWLAGLGTPWNTLQLGGELRLASSGFVVERVQGRWRLDGKVEIELAEMSSRLATLAPLGSYQVVIAGDPAAPGTANIALNTVEGALQLTGTGTWGASGLRLRGEASAQPGDEAALANLLNIIGRRSGTRSVISIG